MRGQIIHKLKKNIRQEVINKAISLVGLVRMVSGQKISVVEYDFTDSSNICLHKIHNLYK